MSDLPVARPQALPENMNYRDTGCHVALSCLECPRALCIYDDPAELVTVSKVYRDRRIVELRKQGVPSLDIARAFKISPRNVHRILARGGPSPSVDEDATEMLEGVRTMAAALRRTSYRRPSPLPPIEANYR